MGGGSVMDCCKAVRLAARYSGDIWTDFWAGPAVGYATAECKNSPRRRENIFRFDLYQNQKGCVVLWNM